MTQNFSKKYKVLYHKVQPNSMITLKNFKPQMLVFNSTPQKYKTKQINQKKL